MGFLISCKEISCSRIHAPGSHIVMAQSRVSVSCRQFQCGL